MKGKYNLLIALFCFGVVFYHFIYNFSIITHPYMTILIFTLCIIAGFNFGVGVAKTLKGK
jgi:hypothetical protein